MIKNIEDIINSIYPIPLGSIELLMNIVSIENHPKSSFLFKENKKDRDIYFIRKGVARIYYLSDITEVNLLLAIEGDSLISLKGYILDEKGYENIEFLENSSVYHLKYSDLQELYETDIHIANWGRKFAEKEFIKTEEKLMSKLFKTATQQYLELLQKHPQLLQRVQLGHIASFLGISQVTLSRIRAEIK
jgi:CRP-like cAMP-binding protein